MSGPIDTHRATMVGHFFGADHTRIAVLTSWYETKVAAYRAMLAIAERQAMLGQYSDENLRCHYEPRSGIGPYRVVEYQLLERLTQDQHHAEIRATYGTVSP